MLLTPAIHDFDYAFSENGLTAYKLGEPLPSQSFIDFIGEERYKSLVKFILHYLADLDIPIKRYLLTHNLPRPPTNTHNGEQRNVHRISQRHGKRQPNRPKRHVSMYLP